ncbi:MAG: STAS domain-containing protein [Acidimicrobiia bacterium]
MSGDVLGLAGEIDLATIPVVRQRLHAAVAARPGQVVVVDLADVTFVDSAGIGILLGARRRARSSGGDLRLVGVSGRVAVALDQAGVGTVFDVKLA